MIYAKQYIEEALLILNKLDKSAVERTADLLLQRLAVGEEQVLAFDDRHGQ